MAEDKVFEGVLAELGERTKRPFEVRRGPLRISFLTCFRDRIVNRAASAQADSSWGSGRVKTERKGEVGDNTESVNETETTTTDDRSYKRLY